MSRSQKWPLSKDMSTWVFDNFLSNSSLNFDTFREILIISLVNLDLILTVLKNFENFLCKSSLDFGTFALISIIPLVNTALIWTVSDRKSDRFHEKNRVPEKKKSSLEKFSDRFLTFRKKFQNLTFFLLECDLFREIDYIFDHD